MWSLLNREWCLYLKHIVYSRCRKYASLMVVHNHKSYTCFDLEQWTNKDHIYLVNRCEYHMIVDRSFQARHTKYSITNIYYELMRHCTNLTMSFFMMHHATSRVLICHLLWLLPMHMIAKAWGKGIWVELQIYTGNNNYFKPARLCMRSLTWIA